MHKPIFHTAIIAAVGVACLTGWLAGTNSKITVPTTDALTSARTDDNPRPSSVPTRTISSHAEFPDPTEDCLFPGAFDFLDPSRAAALRRLIQPFQETVNRESQRYRLDETGGAEFNANYHEAEWHAFNVVKSHLSPSEFWSFLCRAVEPIGYWAETAPAVAPEALHAMAESIGNIYFAGRDEATDEKELTALREVLEVRAKNLLSAEQYEAFYASQRREFGSILMFTQKHKLPVQTAIKLQEILSALSSRQDATNSASASNESTEWRLRSEERKHRSEIAALVGVGLRELEQTPLGRALHLTDTEETSDCSQP